MSRKTRATEESDLILISGVSSDAVSFDTVGQTAEGIFQQQESGVGKNESNLYHFKDSKGAEYSIWGSANLDPILSVAKKGDRIRITYTGKIKTSAGFKCKTFQVRGTASFAERAQKVILDRISESQKGKKGKGKKR